MKLNIQSIKIRVFFLSYLVRQVTADTLNGKNSPAIKIYIQKFFVKSELSKEYKLYETLLKTLL
jgi:hypothetical protein